MEQLFYRYNPQWENGEFWNDLIPRISIMENMVSQISNRQIVFLTGIRRVGKTSLMKLLIKFLINEKGIKKENIFYISIDDFLISKKSIVELVEEYRKIHKLRLKEKVYLFFDEITCKDQYEQQLKNLYDSQNVKIFVSSSSSSIMKSKQPYLTGRYTIIEVLPLDFNEYLLFKEIKLNKSENFLYEKYFEEYLENGGLPEYVLHKDIGYLKNLIDDIIYKDIAALHNIRDIQILKDYFILLMERAGKQVSINKISKILKIAPDTASRYLTMFSDTYLIYLVTRYGKPNEKMLAPKKIYSADLGIRSYFTGLRDKGSLFENYIFLKIKNKNPQYLYKDENEIDFITDDHILIEVKYNSELTEKQKILFENFKAKRKIIVSSIKDLDLLRNI